ncbi:putative uncharacterized protein [Parachlamydia acanthamoebae UV-7]|jgi:hypothetical protein|uniref:Uncharacterized protein n=2 Tax=Parachlamydia acanthamoebae TaxID=83552 RepID=F8KYY8_PARAV|nr:hypothetical protein [Parachlamydia acanthamoebae]KIA78151.1 hypothetical protein DB43_EP00090 [Parachlamydia acanthamoebae]CCB86111.1 putative uncharacterized protein [Parachlamydia acanthamoebae UV-7]
MNGVNNVGLNFGSLLDGLFRRVDDTIHEAVRETRNAGVDLEIEAGREIGIAIENTKNFYRDELNHTIEKVSNAAKNAFDHLDSMVERFQKKNLDELDDLKRLAKQLMNSLPFSSKQPQLFKVNPRNLIIDDITKTSLVIFSGNFYYSSTEGYTPSLVFADKKCYLVDSKTDTLTFQVPHRPFENQNKENYSYITGELNVPWNNGYWGWPIKVESKYQVGIGALPQVAGSCTVEYVAHEMERHIQGKSSPNIFYDGNKWYPEHWHTEQLVIYPDTDWHIDVSQPPHLVAEHVHGDHNESILSYSPDQIVIRVNLYCKSGSDIGKVNVRVEFNQYQDVPVEKKRLENFEVNWKDSRLLEPHGNETISKVIFEDYKGIHQEYGAPDLDRGILKIEAQGNGKWLVWAEAPKELSLQLSELSTQLSEQIQTVHRLKHLLTLGNMSKDSHMTLHGLSMQSKVEALLKDDAAKVQGNTGKRLEESEKMEEPQAVVSEETGTSLENSNTTITLENLEAAYSSS